MAKTTSNKATNTPGLNRPPPMKGKGKGAGKGTQQKASPTPTRRSDSDSGEQNTGHPTRKTLRVVDEVPGMQLFLRRGWGFGDTLHPRGNERHV